MKTYFKVAVSIIVIFVLGVVVTRVYTPSLSEKQALVMIYGNYDQKNKSANWINIPFPNKEDVTGGYFEERRGIVRTIFFQPFYENGKNKIFLLTKTIPTNIPFDCHACLPLIGATVFVKKNRHWEIEAQNQFIMYDGEYGELPAVKLIQVGQDKFGLSIEFEHGVVRDKELSILIPYNKNIMQAHREIVYYENFNDCEFSRSIQCDAYTANVNFNKSNKDVYYDLKVQKFGTTYSEKRNKNMPVDETITYKFINGKYKETSHAGSNYIENDEA